MSPGALARRRRCKRCRGRPHRVHGRLDRTRRGAGSRTTRRPADKSAVRDWPCPDARRAWSRRRLGLPHRGVLGSVSYYSRFGFVPAQSIGLIPPDPSWGEHFQARPRHAWTATCTGVFKYAAPFEDLSRAAPTRLQRAIADGQRGDFRTRFSDAVISLPGRVGRWRWGRRADGAAPGCSSTVPA